MKNKLFSNTIYLYVLTIVKMVFPLITLPYLTRMLSVEAYGFVVYVKSYMTYVQLILDFGFLLSATKNIAIAKGKDNKKIEYIIGDTFAEKIILLLIAGVVTFIASICIPLLGMDYEFLWLYFIAIGITIFLPDFLYRGIERMECVAIPYSVSKVISVTLTMLLVKNDGDMIFIPIFEIVSNVVAVLISLMLLRKLKIQVRFSCVKNWFKDLKESAVYFVSNFATTVFGVLTTIIVGIVVDEVEVAYWGVCMQIVSAAKSMYAPITNSIYPYMVTNRDIKLVRRIRNLMSLPMLLGSVIVLLYGEQITVIIGGKDYVYAGTVLKFLLPVIVASFYSMLYGWPVLGAMGKIKQTTISTVIAAIIQIGGIAIIYCLGVFDLISLAICCSISEVQLFIIRYVMFIKNKELMAR